MPSPFPGMNPYLEHPSVFHGFHQNLVIEIQRALVPQARPTYIVDTDVSVYIHELSREQRLVGRPDVSVSRGDGSASATAGPLGSGATVLSELVPAVDVVKVPYVKVMDPERQVITVIEVLSQTNKLNAADRVAYLAKRNALLRTDAHFIEIDVLRAGEPMPLTVIPTSDYRIMLSRAAERPQVTLWPLRLREGLPSIPVPVRSPDLDLTLDLQAALHRVYDAAGYANYLYDRPPQPALHPEDAAWAQSLIGDAVQAR